MQWVEVLFHCWIACLLVTSESTYTLLIRDERAEMRELV